jgi:hypothetical protein
MSKIELDISIPNDLSGITVQQYQEYAKLWEDNKEAEDYEFINKKTLEIFCGLDLKESFKIPINTLDNILSHINDCFKEDKPFINRFKMTDAKGVTVEFGFEPSLDKISYGAFKDAENYMRDVKDLHKLMAVLYRPVIKDISNKYHYRIADYEGSDKFSEVMKDAPVNVALGMQVFFYRLGTKLSKYTMDSLMEQAKLTTNKEGKQLLEENGEIISRFYASHKTMYEDLTKSQSFHYTNV